MRNVHLLRRAAAVLIGTAAGAAIATSAAGSASAAPSPGVCSGGSILAGTYASLTVTGDCTLDKGTVNVTGNVSVKPNANLTAMTPGSDLRVKGNVSAGTGAGLALGCSPSTLACLKDNPEFPTHTVHVYVGGGVSATDASSVVLNSASVARDVVVKDTMLESRCLRPIGLVVAGTDVGGAVRIVGNLACSTTFAHNRVNGDVTFNNNAGGDNTVEGNVIGGDLRCSGNIPAPSAPHAAANLVAGLRTGQCTSTSLP